MKNQPTVLQAILSKNTGKVSDEHISAFAAAGWHLYQNDGCGYTDFEYCTVYQTRAENNHADYSLNVHLTIDWEGGEVYLMLGTNFGDGFNDEHYVGNDGQLFDKQVERCINDLRESAEDDQYLVLISNQPDAWARVMSAVSNLGQAVGTLNPLQQHVA